ncbi:protein prenylyltransferase [Westerdykella ornata]|uniref:Protein prenylyltransferase n=1 Tax=Westerdykella ornata TaxID=318751 RepID=A0A6A6JNS8_WESOR|nr:protein prenylyltransferase [Westerdykella ornata]KAF2277548.1 protein prenylyltransferase [Westerdykella ornata]
MASHADSAHDLLDLDIHTLRLFVELFPEDGLSKVITGYLSSGVSKYPLSDEVPDLSEGGVALTPHAVQDAPRSQQDCLLLMTEGLEEAKKSPLAHCLLADYWLSLEEYESAVELSRQGLKLAATEARKSGLPLKGIQDALNSTLATALVYYQTPRHHAEAKEIFQSILKRKPQFTPALIGIGLILEEEEEYAQAVDFLEKALKQDPENGRIGAESAWCQGLNGNYKTALDRLQEYLEYPQMDASKPRGRELRAQTLYRIGVCIWELDASKAARKNRQGAYAKFLAAIKADPNFAPAYTKLGIFYEDYNHDRKRARQCFQKAFELSPSELLAAERLARYFADQGEWDIVEVIAQRVVDSGKARAAPGSTKQGASWPFSALGVVNMNKLNFQQSIVMFLSALRISPDDYHSYVGLGESYHNSGRYNSAARAFNYAENPTDGVVMRKADADSWFTKYMLANVHRELSEFNEAIGGYEEVLKQRPGEFGVLIALLQALVEKAWRCIDTGFFGEAASTACKAIDVASQTADVKPGAFNLWKAVGDAVAVFTWVQEKLPELPQQKVKDLLSRPSEGVTPIDYDSHNDLDGVGSDKLATLVSSTEGVRGLLPKALYASILAQKRAIVSCAGDVYAQAVAWYNLGWTEYRTHVCLEQEQEDPGLSIHLRAAMKCFKRAIELEAGNSEFWNSMGVITTTLNPKVAQHSFVRSLSLNEHSARTWTNLGTLYLLQNDQELAHLAFSRAQSTDPDYALAWVGEGIIALLYGDSSEALSHFTHAFELAESSTLLTKRQYALSTFDHLASSPAASNNITHLVQPLFALNQLCFQAPHDMPHKHLAALFMERIGSHDAAIKALTSICEAAEQDYETSESTSSLARYAQAKADLARNLLATHEFQAAVEEAETALDLLTDFEDISVLSTDALNRIRLSARLTAGLAHFNRSDLEASLTYFRTSLEETGSDPDIICLLAEVLWAKGGTDEKEVAREQLFAAIEKHERHVGILTLLGAIAVLDADAETAAAVVDDLQSLRTDKSLDDSQLLRVEKVCEAIALLLGGELEATNELKRSIVMAPWKYAAWQDLSDATGHGFPAVVTRETASRSVPPNGNLSAEGLASAFAGTGAATDAQRAIVLAPWSPESWGRLTELVAKS